MTPHFGLQLYTLREACARDLAGTLAFVARCGYAGVEVAALHERAAIEFRALLDASGLAVASLHALPFGDAAERVFDDAQTLGAPLVVVPFAHPERFKSPDGLREIASELNAASAAARRRGLRLAYHNHFWEWTRLADGTSAFDALIAALDPAAEIELDIYWATVAKQNPAGVLRALGARATRLHLKDGPADRPESPMTALGDGVVDLTGAIAAAAHADWMLVELDACAGDLLEAVKRSAEWLSAARAAGRAR